MIRVAFYAQADHRFDAGISHALKKGIRRCGDQYQILPIEQYNGSPSADVDVAVFQGVKGRSRLIFDTYRAVGKPTLVIDKGYTRIQGGPLDTLYWRFSTNALQPHQYLDLRSPPDRWERLKIPIKPMVRKQDGAVMFCGGSQKYCDWHGLGDANDYAQHVLDKLRKHTDRPLIYRPKPGWPDARRLPGYGFSGPKFSSFRVDIQKTFQLVTFGSNAAFEALLMGVPALVLGDGVARSLARLRVDDIDRPLYPARDEVYRLACAVAYCQFTVAEMEDGTCWRHLRPQVTE